MPERSAERVVFAYGLNVLDALTARESGEMTSYSVVAGRLSLMDLELRSPDEFMDARDRAYSALRELFSFGGE